MILVTGATGHVGSKVVEQLAAQSAKVRALVHHSPLQLKSSNNLDTQNADLANAATLQDTMQDVDYIFLLVTAPGQAKNIIQAAKRHGVKHIVYLSSIGAGAVPPLKMDRFHAEDEQLLKKSGIDWTILRSSFMMSNCLTWADTIKSEGKVYDGFGAGKMPLVDPADIASVASNVLLHPKLHKGHVHELTGSELLTTHEQTDILSTVLHKPIEYIKKSTKDMANLMMKNGFPKELADAYKESMDRTRKNEFETTTETIHDIIKSSPRTFEQWCQAHAKYFA